jgi:CRISPR-associated protein Cas1
MLKRTIVLSSQAYLKKEQDQLVIQKGEEVNSVPIEDIGVLLLESYQVTITQPVLSALMENDAVVITCDATHHPNGIMLPVSGNSIHSAILRAQLNASKPLRKLLWTQTVKAKLLNQAALLESIGEDAAPLMRWAKQVRSGDSSNLEGRGAQFYWNKYLPHEFGFAKGHSPMFFSTIATQFFAPPLRVRLFHRGFIPQSVFTTEMNTTPFALLTTLWSRTARMLMRSFGLLLLPEKI